MGGGGHSTSHVSWVLQNQAQQLINRQNTLRIEHQRRINELLAIKNQRDQEQKRRILTLQESQEINKRIQKKFIESLTTLKFLQYINPKIGKHYCFIGPTSCGKSSLWNALFQLKYLLNDEIIQKNESLLTKWRANELLQLDQIEISRKKIYQLYLQKCICARLKNFIENNQLQRYSKKEVQKQKIIKKNKNSQNSVRQESSPKQSKNDNYLHFKEPSYHILNQLSELMRGNPTQIPKICSRSLKQYQKEFKLFKSSLQLIVFNISSVIDNQNERYKDIIRMLQETTAQVVCLQECQKIYKLICLNQKINKKFYYPFAFRLQQQRQFEFPSTLILTTLPCSFYEIIPYYITAQHKSFHFIRLQLETKNMKKITIGIYSIHLKSNLGRKEAGIQSRYSQLKQINKICQLNDINIITGDFNFPNDTVKEEQFLKSQKYLDLQVLKQPFNHSQKWTYKSRNFKNPFKDRVDRIYVRGCQEWVPEVRNIDHFYRIGKHSLYKFPQYDKKVKAGQIVGPSDHLGINCELNFWNYKNQQNPFIKSKIPESKDCQRQKMNIDSD